MKLSQCIVIVQNLYYNKIYTRHGENIKELQYLHIQILAWKKNKWKKINCIKYKTDVVVLFEILFILIAFQKYIYISSKGLSMDYNKRQLRFKHSIYKHDF